MVEGMVTKLKYEVQHLEQERQLKEEALEEMAASSRTQLSLMQEVRVDMRHATCV
jgi:hypothetical protein